MNYLVYVAYVVLLWVQNSLPQPDIGNRMCTGMNDMHGMWKDRTYFPSNCTYRPISSAQGRQCLTNRTIACIGDSIMRDMCNGLGMFLEGYSIGEVADVKFDKSGSPADYAFKIGSFQSWTFNREEYNGLVYPKPGGNDTWQVQSWVMKDGQFLGHQHLDDVLTGRVQQEEPVLHNISLAFWSYGLHEKPRWDREPYGERYFAAFVSRYLQTRASSPVPLVWTSINEHCEAHDPLKVKQPGYFKRQAEMVRQANNFTRYKLREMKVPYYDFAAPLRTAQICELSADGIHVKMWVDLVRAQILLNHLCDEDNHWIGSAEAFIS